MTFQKTIFANFLNLLFFLSMMTSVFALEIQDPLDFELSPKYWTRFEFLTWFTKAFPSEIPLVTTASWDDPLPGALGQPGTHIVLGADHSHIAWQSGIAFSLGSWVNLQQTIGVEACYFGMSKTHRDRSLTTNGNPGDYNYAVPIYDTTGIWGLKGNPGETIFLLTGPVGNVAGFEGQFALDTKCRFQGVDLTCIVSLICQPKFEIEVLGGLCWWQLEESFTFLGKTNTAIDSTFNNNFMTFEDHFKADNDFICGQLGLKAKYTFFCFELEGLFKSGFGLMYQQIKINGTSETAKGNLFLQTQGTYNSQLDGGIFTQSSNIGKHQKKTSAFNLETRFSGLHHLTSCIDLKIGYNFLFLTSVERPGHHISRKINTTRTSLAESSRETVGVGSHPIAFGEPGLSPKPTGSLKPDFSFRSSLFWAQSLSIGILFKF